MRGIRTVRLGVLVTAGMWTVAAAAGTDSPAYLRKLAQGDAYRVDHHPGAGESICGKSDLQQINDYKPKLERGVDFARLHKFAVGAMADTNTATSAKYCSGTLVGKDLFLTAGHCVDTTTIGQYVSFNYENAPGTTTLMAQDYYKIAAVAETGKDLDYAVVKLDGDPGLKWGWVDVRTSQAGDQEVLTIIQHPNAEPKQIDVGHAAGFEGNYVKYADLDTEPGSSGSGVLDSLGRQIGVHTNGGCTETDGYNTGVRLSAVTPDTLIAKLAAQTVPFKDGGAVQLTVAGTDSGASLAADVANHDVSLAHEGANTVTTWTVVDLHDGSYNLKATDLQGRSAYLDGRADSGKVTLRDTLDPADLGAKWRIVPTDDGHFVLHTVGGTAGPRWLSGASSVGLTDTASGWQISAR